MPIKIRLESKGIDPATEHTMLLVAIAIGLAICLATAVHWYRSRLDVSPDGGRHVSWRPHFVAMDHLRKIKVGEKSGTVMLAFYSTEKKPLFSISSFAYGAENIARIVEHIQALAPRVQVAGYKSRQDLDKREVAATEKTTKQVRLIQGTFSLLAGGFLLYLAVSPGAIVSPIF